MSNAPESGLSSNSNSSYGSSNTSAAPVAAKRAPAYRRSLSLEQSQNIKEAEVLNGNLILKGMQNLILIYFCRVNLPFQMLLTSVILMTMRRTHRTVAGL